MFNRDNVYIVPVHNALPYVQQTLNDLINPEITTPCSMVVVNDSSGEETTQYLKSFAQNNPNVTLLHNTAQQLFTRTVNRGLRKAWSLFRPKFLTVVNSDCRLQPHWDLFMSLIMEEQDIGLVGYRDSTPPDLPDLYEDVRSPGFVTGHLLMLRTQALLEVGVFCESDTGGLLYPEYAPYKGLAHIGSDRHLCACMQKGGYRTVYCNEQGVEHEAGKSWGHDLGWLSQFQLVPMWEANDRLE